MKVCRDTALHSSQTLSKHFSPLQFFACHRALFVVIVLLSLSSSAQLLQGVFIDGGYSHSYAGGIWGGGVSMVDFTGDGRDDVTMARNGERPLFLVGGDSLLQYIQIPFPLSGEIKQLCWLDIDDDGDRDLSMSGFNMPFMIFERIGELELVPLDSLSGLSNELIVGYGHSWGDYDRDGDLDVFVCNYDAAYMGLMDADNRLYRNDGNFQFTDVTDVAGFPSMVNYTFMALWMDYNRDLYPDLLVLNDRYEVPNYFYHNNGDGTFTEMGQSANLDDFIWSMTATADDYDNDGDLDIYITNGPQGNYHKRNNGDGTFSDVADFLGTAVNHFCWSAQFLDLNRDGWQDLHVCSTPIGDQEGKNFALMNEQIVFEDATELVGIGNDNGWSRGSALGDINHDGLADMVVSKNNPSFSSFWTAIANENHGLKVTLKGTVSNREGVCSWIDAYADSLHQSRYTYCGEGYLGQNSFSEFFGWGARLLIDSLVVSWPSGIVDRWYNIPVDQQLHLVEGTSRIIEVVAVDGWGHCHGDSTIIQANDWDTYAWSTGSEMSAVSVTQSQAITVEVTDAWGNRFVSDTMMVSAYEPVGEVHAEVVHVSCQGLTDGSVQLIADDADVWYILNGDTTQAGMYATLPAGSYMYEVVNANGCRDTLAFEVEEPEVFTVSGEITHCTCAETADGSIRLVYSGGTPGYSLMGNPSTAQLSAGDYALTAVDANGCSASLSFSIGAPSALEITCTSVAALDGEQNGSITAEASGGIPPYEWLLDGLPSDSAVWNGLSSGAFLLTALDAVGCSMQVECIVEQALTTTETDLAAFAVYPNPVEQGMPWAIIGASAGSEVVITNSMGQVVNRLIVESSGRCSTNYMSKGLYFVSLMKDDLPQGSFLLQVN
jgi:hypothetical protein